MAAVNVTFPGNLAQVDSIADLRALPSTYMSDDAAYLVDDDGLFSFDPSSLAADDGSLVIKPTDRASLEAGRWVLAGANRFSGLARQTSLDALSAGLAASDGAMKIGYKGVGAGTIARPMNQKAGDILSVKDFGAVGDGVADDTLAVLNAMRALQRNVVQYEARASLYFPAGTYRVTQSGVLSAALNSTDTFGGYLLFGDGEASAIWLDCRGATQNMWLYDNGTQRRSFGNIYRDLTFVAGLDWKINATSTDMPAFISDRGGLFKFTGRTLPDPGGESAHQFFGCTFRFARTAIWIDGDDNADVIRVFGGNAQSCARFMMLNSRASYQNVIRDLYVQYGFGPLVEFGANAVAASVSASGGQVVLAAEPTAISRWGVPTAVLSVVGGPTLQSHLCDFSDIRWELYDQAKLFDLRYGGTFRFTGSARNTNAAAKVMGVVGGTGVVAKLEDFASDDGGTGVSTFEINAPVGFTTESKLSIDGESIFSAAALDAITFTGTGGQLHIGGDVKGLIGATMANVEPQIRAFAVDRSPNGFSSSQGRGASLKSVRLDLGGAPDSLSGVVTMLPKGAVIVAVKARIQPGVGVNNPYRVILSNGDKSLIYAMSTAANQNNVNGHIAAAEGILRNVGTVENARRIRLYADEGNGNAPPAGSGSAPIVAIVEYY